MTSNAQLDQQILDREKPGLKVQCMSAVVAKAIVWLWLMKIALGKVTVLAGEGGLGKSTILCDIAARVTNGSRWPDGTENAFVGNVIILASEDAADDTLKPRLAAAGADMSRVFVVTAVRETESGPLRSFNLQADINRLEQKIAEIGNVLLVIIDPISSYLGKVDSHKNAEVRSVLEPLGNLATRTGCAIVCNNHFSKGGGGANGRIIGSVAFVNQARAAFIVAQDAGDPDRRLFLPSKMNIAVMGEGLAYRIGGYLAQVDGLEIPTSQVCWESTPVTTTADAALRALEENSESGNRSAQSEAEEWLRDLLANGAVPAKQVKTDAAAAGLSWATVRRAKDRIGVHVERVSEGFAKGGHWNWRLPSHDQVTATPSTRCSPAPQDAHVSDVSALCGSEHLVPDEDDPADWSVARLAADEMPDLQSYLDRRRA
jgi:putative DNA primase/helicase